MNPIIRNLTAAASLIALVGCSTTGDSTASNTSRAQFLNEVWVSPEIHGKAVSDLYTSVYFAPVTVGHLKEQSWWASQNVRTQEHLTSDALRLAHHMHNSLITAAHYYPEKRMHVVMQPGPGTLVVETSITELVPAKAFWNAAATAAGFMVPGAGVLGAAGKGAIGFEGRLRDGHTGAVIADFRHRALDKMALVNVDSYTWYAGSEANIDEIAERTAKVLNTPAETVVNRPVLVKLVAFSL